MSSHRSIPSRIRILLAAAVVAGSSASAVRNSSAAEWEPIEKLVAARCVDCHQGPEAASGFDVKALGRDLARPENLAKWVRAYDRVERGEMPPQDADKVPQAERDGFLKSLSESLNEASAARAEVVLRRLNRTEYENTLRDMLGIRTPLKDALPEDGKADGFDNVGEALDLSSVQLQRYLEAAGLAINDAVRHGPQPERQRKTYRFDEGRNAENIGKHWHRTAEGAVVVFNDGGFPSIAPDPFRAPADGTYRIRLDGFAYQSERPITYGVYAGQFGRNADSKLVGFFQAQPGASRTIEFDAYLYRNESFRILPRITRNSYNELKRDGPAAYTGPGLALKTFEIDGPIYADWPGRGHRLLFGDLPAVEQATEAERNKKNFRPRYEIETKQPAADAERLLKRFAPVAFRRPVDDTKLAPYVALAKAELADGAKFEDAMRTAYVAILCSPDFVYLREPQSVLDDYALATRLAYFLWSSLPDDELTAVAASGNLAKPEVLRTQTERMLAAPQAARFTKNFVGQWLNLRDLEFTTPDKQLYPEFDNLLLDSMARETELFFDEVLKSNRPLHDFIDSDWTMLNERLAEHYRIDGVAGLEFRKTALKPEHHRGGLLTQASVLKVSANGTTTSPVTRGGWVLERILNQPPPPPPPGVPGVEPDIRGATTLREQLAKHRSLEACNNCHKVIDPPGFALENYDVMGGYRENYRALDPKLPSPPTELTGGRRVSWRIGPKVDASGATVDGTKFENLADYKRILLADRNVFARALAEKLIVYATGRSLGFSDRPETAKITSAVAAKGYGFRDLVHEIVQSAIFRHK